MKIYYLFVIFFLFLCIFACKTVDDINDGGNSIKDETADNIDRRTTFVIDEKTINDDDLRMHMKNLFDYIEEIIARGDYGAWYSSLSTAYKNYLNDRTVLKKMSSDSDILNNKGIILKTPKDYFEYVVIEARTREEKVLKFKDFKYIDKNHVKVICQRGENERFQYNFIFEDNCWKLDR